jgi:hypothetical protein
MSVSCECLCCQVEVSATGRSVIQRSPTECGVCLSVIKWKINNLDTCCEQAEEGRTRINIFCYKNNTRHYKLLHISIPKGHQQAGINKKKDSQKHLELSFLRHRSLP